MSPGEGPSLSFQSLSDAKPRGYLAFAGQTGNQTSLTSSPPLKGEDSYGLLLFLQDDFGGFLDALRVRAGLAA